MTRKNKISSLVFTIVASEQTNIVAVIIVFLVPLAILAGDLVFINQILK